MSIDSKPLVRIGIGYDVHRLVTDRPLILGGVTVPFDRGLAGHSDADVLLHAAGDALLGAVALGDLGKHFPDTSEDWAGVDSMNLLSTIVDLVKDEGYHVTNMDTTVVLEEPKLSPHIRSMRENIARVIEAPITSVSVKATTSEGLGFVGRQEGIAAHAVCTVSLGDNPRDDQS